ncbi:hypothetical protein [Novosphingobium sp.]|uniref:hypothetical protein n=1 Tax=Novosphingobium sp. TaxID=1874826 RepID=UPI003B529158
MIAVADTSVLLHFFDPDCRAPLGDDGQQIGQCKERVEALILRLSRDGDVLIVPTPTLAEILTRAGAAGPVWLGAIEGKRAIRIEPFGLMAAVECAAMSATRKARNPDSNRAKSKFDEQIIAIARVVGADEIYSDDVDIRKLAGSDFTVYGIADLPPPPPQSQPDMFEP